VHKIFKKIFVSIVVISLFIQSVLSTPVLAKSKHDNPNDYKFSFYKLPRHFGQDLKESFWGLNGLFFVLATGAAAAFHPVDTDIKNSLGKGEVFSSGFDRTVGYVLAPYTIAGVSALTLIIANGTNKPKLSLAMESTLESLALTLAFTGLGKVIIDRTRPDGGKYSMPSGHTSAAFSTATVLMKFYGVKVAVPAYLLASLTAFTRIDDQKHFLTDVLVGAVLGTAIGLGTASFHKKEYRGFVITPMVTKNGTGLVFHKTF